MPPFSTSFSVERYYKIALPDDFLACLPSHQCPSFREIQEFAGKRRLRITNDGIAVLRIRNFSPAANSETYGINETTNLFAFTKR